MKDAPSILSELRPYSNVKDAGAPWLSDVPAQWELRRMKTVLRERTEKGFPDEPLLAATQTKGVILKRDFEARTVLALKDLHLLKRVHVGDFVISLRSFQGGIEYARHKGIISPAYTVLVVVDQATSGYLSWLFKSKPYIANLSLFVTGIRQGQNIDYEKLGRSVLPFPPPAEQSAIVRYLRDADRRIKRFVAIKQRLIKLLDEQRKRIVSVGVTRGVNRNVRLRPSGNDWLGNMPEHWRAGRIKTELINLNTRRVPLSSSERGEMTRRSYDYYGASGVIDRVDDYLFDDDLLLIAEDGANLVNRNLPLAIVARGRFWVNNHAHILKPKEGCLEFFAALLESIDYNPWITGAAQPKLTQDRLMAIPIPVPPAEEQEQIVAWIKSKTGDISGAIDRARGEVALLREFRDRLIADVVTGKVDVREAAAGLPGELLEGGGEDDEIAAPGSQDVSEDPDVDLELEGAPA